MAAPVNDTGNQKIIPTGGDGDSAAVGRVQPVTGLEMKPCVMCQSFSKDEPKLVQLLHARGMTVGVDGSFTTPIAKEVGYKPMVKNVKDFGWCKYDCIIVEDLATCPKWMQRRDLRGLVK